MATDWRTRKARREAGWLEVSCLLPPELVQIMEESRGDQHRSRWLVQQALTLLAPDLVDQVAMDRGKGGRPRTRLPTLPDLRIPLRHLTYRPVILPHYLHSEIDQHRQSSITLKIDLEGRTVVLYRKFTAFGGVEVYDMTRRHGGRWGCHWIQGSTTSLYGVVMPSERSTNVIIDWVRQHGGEIVDERVQHKFVGVLRSRPLVERSGDDTVAWSLEIDITASRERGTLRDVHRFLCAAWNWCPTGIGWYRIEEVPDLLVSSGLTEDELRAIWAWMIEHQIDIVQDEPWGVSQDPVIVRPDEIGLMYAVEANRQDRRCLPLPLECAASDWAIHSSRVDALGVMVREELPPAPDLPDIDWTRVPGWSQPVASGKLLREYQRQGIEFVVRCGFRCMIGDSMRVGKTAQAIGAVNARGCRRVVAILPRSVVHVWKRQINEWSNSGEEPTIIEIRNSTVLPDLPRQEGRTWVLVTYDMVTPRLESIMLKYREDQQQEIQDAFTAVGADKALTRVDDKTLKIVLDPDDESLLRAAEQVVLPGYVREAEKCRAALIRAGGPVRSALAQWDPDAVLVDEAHRIKNPRAARTRTVRTLIQDHRRLGLLLSGTLIRNYYQREGLPLLEAVVSLDEHYRRAKRAGIPESELTKLLLQRYMIRRELREVESDLPEKIREKVLIPLGPKGTPFFEQYVSSLNYADEVFYRVAAEGGDIEEAKKQALGAWSKARHALVDAKVADGAIAEAVEETVEAAGCCIVFGHHVSALDALAKQLIARGLTVATAYGDITTRQKVEAERLFQEGIADVYIGSLQTAEGISLNRADACVHIEQDYVPGTMLQAEARAQGVGQKAPRGYLVRTCMNDFGLAWHDNIDALVAAILARKLAGLNELYDEDETLDATLATAAGDLSSSLAKRSWAKAQERLHQEGKIPKDPDAPKDTQKPTKGTDKTRKRGTSEDPPA